jgi:SAM-dependent methyltransferase
MECICCHSDNPKKKFKKNSFQIYECRSCGFQFVHPLPSMDLIEAHYNKTRVSNDIRGKIRKYLHDFKTNSNHPKRDWYDRILAKAKSYLNKQSLSILEIGSAYGYFVDYCNNNGHKAIGVEVTQEYASASKDLINGIVLCLKTDDYKKQFGDKKFDFIYLEHVFEHVLDPTFLLENLVYLLNDQGIIIIVVPNHKSFLSRLFRKHYLWTNPPDHLYFYDENSLRTLAERAKLQSVESWTGDYYHRSIYQFYSLDIFIHTFYRVLNKLFKLNINTQHSYKYPRKLADILTLIPYFVLFPLINLLNKKYGMGNELTVILQKEKEKN